MLKEKGKDMRLSLFLFLIVNVIALGMEKPQPLQSISESTALETAARIQKTMNELSKASGKGSLLVKQLLQEAFKKALIRPPSLSEIFERVQSAQRVTQDQTYKNEKIITTLYGSISLAQFGNLPIHDLLQYLNNLMLESKVKEQEEEEKNLKEALAATRKGIEDLEKSLQQLQLETRPAAKPKPRPIAAVSAPVPKAPSRAKPAAPKAVSSPAGKPVPKIPPLSPASKGKIPPQQALPLRGLPNPDNRCFMNAALQSTLCLDSVVDAVLIKALQDPDFYTVNPMTDTFIKLAQSQKENTAYDPKEFCLTARARMNLRAAQQADAAEFLQLLLDTLISPGPDAINAQLARLVLFTITNYEEGIPHQEQRVLLEVAPEEKTLKECIESFFLPQVRMAGKTQVLRPRYSLH